ncbi:MAG TPA: hypothetical protein PKA06_08860, partial [Gemmatales bacterium]|nr:hypothetical protein [Gemmatales bacterium]
IANQKEVQHVLGFVDAGTTLLLLTAEVDAKSPRTVMQKMVVEGRDTATGKSKYSYPVPAELVCSWSNEGQPQLVNDGKALLFLAHYPTTPAENRLVLYDWRKQKVLRRYDASPYDLIHRAFYRGGALLISAATRPVEDLSEYLVYWHPDQAEPVSMPFKNCIGFISDDGNYAAAYSLTEWFFAVLDLRRQSILQRIPSNILHFRWLPESQGFLTVVSNQQHKGACYAQRYTRQEEKFVPMGEEICLLPQPGDFRFGPDYLLARSHTRFENWRKYLQEYTGGYLNFLVHIWWPAGSIRQQHDPDTGKLLHRFVLPPAFSRTGMAACPHEHTVAIYDENNFSLWQYPTHGAYYPLIGLLLGCAYSAIVYFRWYREHQRALQQLPYVYLRRNRPLEQAAPGAGSPGK